MKKKNEQCILQNGRGSSLYIKDAPVPKAFGLKSHNSTVSISATFSTWIF